MPDLTITQLALELQVSTSKLSRLTRAGRIPCLRIGRAVRYELEPVKAALRVPVQPLARRPAARVRRRAVRVTVTSGVLPAWVREERQRIYAENRSARQAEVAS